MTHETKTVREMIAYRLYDAGAYCGECDYEGWGECSECMREALVFADVVERFLVEDRRVIIAAYCAERNEWMERAHKAEAKHLTWWQKRAIRRRFQRAAKDWTPEVQS